MAYKNPLEQAEDIVGGFKYTPFKLDREKYPDVEETPYGFIYNVNGRSITDANAQNRKFGFGKEGVDYGWTLEVDGDEAYYPDFESAYKAAKGIK